MNNWSMVCPNCKSSEDLQLQLHLWVQLLPDGSDVIQQDHEWESTDRARCVCGWDGTVKDCEDAYDSRIKYEVDNFKAAYNSTILKLNAAREALVQGDYDSFRVHWQEFINRKSEMWARATDVQAMAEEERERGI